MGPKFLANKGLTQKGCHTNYFKNNGISIVLEILLSVIEIIGKKFEADSLGPSTIVRSVTFYFLSLLAFAKLNRRETVLYLHWTLVPLTTYIGFIT